MRLCALAILVSTLVLASAPRTASADPTAADKETARALMDEADKKFEAKDFAGALKGYLAADALMNVPTTAIEVAHAQIASGQLVEARETTIRISRMPKGAKEPAAFTKARAEADALGADLAGRIPSIKITVEGLSAGAAASVTVDGAEVPDAALGLPRKIDPGVHVVAASSPGVAPVRKSITVAERQELPVVLTFGAAAAGETRSGAEATIGSSKSRSIVPWIAFGAGAVGLGVGVVTGIVSLSKASSAKALCPTDVTCKPAAQPDIDSSKTFALVSDVGFGVAIAGAAVGVVTLLVLKPSRPATTGAASFYITPSPGGASAGVGGAF
jgi:hypothetical protein